MNDHELVVWRYSPRENTAYGACSCGWKANVTHHFESTAEGKQHATRRVRERFDEHVEAASYPVEA